MLKKILFFCFLFSFIFSQTKDLGISPEDETLSGEIKTDTAIKKVTIPPGSFVKVRVLNAGNFPVKEARESIPVILQVIGNIVLPNNYEVDFDGALMEGTAIGEYSTSRVKITVDKISYIINKKVFVTKVNGFVISTNGLHGLEGVRKEIEAELVSKSVFVSLLSSLLKAGVTFGQITINKPIGIVSTNNNNIEQYSATSTIIDYVAKEYLTRILEMSMPYVFMPNDIEGRVIFITRPFTIYVKSVKIGNK